MGGTDSKYLSELSESDSSDEECDLTTSAALRTNASLPMAQECDLTRLTTDAALRTNASLPKADEVLNIDRVLTIENSLDTEEIVSLVFLLFEDTRFALQDLYVFLRGSPKKPLHSWAVVQEGRKANWQNQFIEALCIIKNYEVLKDLGYKKDAVITHFLPHNGLTCIHLNKIKKVCFLICEHLNHEKTKTLIEHAMKKVPEQNKQIGGFDPQFLEICFMNWEVTKSVTLFDIKSILKIMEEEHLCNILEGVLSTMDIPEREQHSTHIDTSHPESRAKPPTWEHQNSQLIRDAYFENQLPSTSNSNTNGNGNTTTRVDNPVHQEFGGYFLDYQFPVNMGQDNINTESNGDDDTLNRYQVDPDKPGIVLIINQESFYSEIGEKYKHLLPPDATEKLESRFGTEKDRDDLKKVFTNYGFKVLVENNLNHIDMMIKIKEVVESVRDESSLFICILTHGDKGIVYGANSCRVKVNKIKDVMFRTNKTNLTDKPKILILQSCQGRQCQKLGEDDEYEDDDSLSLTTDGPSAPLRDMYTFWATIPGYAAIRDKRSGSWFIQALCKKMEDIGNKHHFADICTRTANEVTSKIWTNETDKKAMTPYVQSTLLKDFYLPPLKNKS
ncbi:hypothetical protein JTB14_014598 [Gonioctena quinquepunctata]|nr:hypothetical protein JTB14_014598 [Gonioctena quinquepunctata]